MARRFDLLHSHPMTVGKDLVDGAVLRLQHTLSGIQHPLPCGRKGRTRNGREMVFKLLDVLVRHMNLSVWQPSGAIRRRQWDSAKSQGFSLRSKRLWESQAEPLQISDPAQRTQRVRPRSRMGRTVFDAAQGQAALCGLSCLCCRSGTDQTGSVASAVMVMTSSNG